MNSREKGKRIERYFKNKLLSFFPEAQRNANGQSQSGGIDLINTPGFSFEIKGGTKYKIGFHKNLQQWLDKLHAVAPLDTIKVILFRPDHINHDINTQGIPAKDLRDLVIMSMEEFEKLLLLTRK